MRRCHSWIDQNASRHDEKESAVKIAILDDYQNVALKFADWSRVASKADITVFTDHLSEPDNVVTRLQPFDVLCVMRERTPLPREIIERLPRLKMIASTGPGNASVDERAARERNIHLTHTGYRSTPTIELTWALILASARNLVAGRHRSVESCPAGCSVCWAWAVSVAKWRASARRSG
jgi:lactate dehydrogenase-like 2-hydroxyacid dehydrogenase